MWAPNAAQAELVLDGARHPMRADGRGFWVADITPVDGQRYAFSLFDGSTWTPPFPDPRTRFQPDGVHGQSEVYAREFTWSDHAWRGVELKDQVQYELHVGTFTPEGTFAGVAGKLNYLAELGVNAIELMPVQPFPGARNWGYDGVDWHAVHAEYGGPDELKRLVDAAHAKGIAVLLDVVYNHFGPEGNYTYAFGPYTTPGATGWGDAVNISGWGSDEVRAYILDAVAQWLGEFHIDGLRLDAVQAYDDRRAYSIMEDIRAVADRIAGETGVPRTIVGESTQDDPRIVTPREHGGYGLDGQWLFDLNHAMHALITGERHGHHVDYGGLEELADVLRNGFHFRGTYSEFYGCSHGRPLDLSLVRPWQMVAYTTNHDETGNRPRGDRPSQSLSPAQLALKAAVVLLGPFTPMLFMGEEFGARTPFPFFISHSDERAERDAVEGRAGWFAAEGWGEVMADPADEATFASAKLDWDAQEQLLLDTYRDLIALRPDHAIARRDLRDIEVAHDGRWLTMADSAHVLAANFTGQEAAVPVEGTLIYSFGSPTVSSGETVLAPWGFALLRR